VAALGKKNVGGLDIAVNDAFGVCRVQCFRDFDCYGQEFIDRQRLAGDAMFQGRTF
jgi:hypothetical protein